MAQYVCDFDTVTSVGNSIIKAGNNLLESTSSYCSNIDSCLSGWSGTAKDSAIKQINEQSEKYVSSVKDVVAYGEYLLKVSNDISNAESELANWSL